MYNIQWNDFISIQIYRKLFLCVQSKKPKKQINMCLGYNLPPWHRTSAKPFTETILTKIHDAHGVTKGIMI